MTRPIAVLHPVNQAGVPEALAAIPGLDLRIPPTEAEVADALVGADILISRRWHPAFMRPELRWLQSLSAGVEQFPIAELRGRGIEVTTAGDVFGVVAEHAIALLLALLRDLHHAAEDRGRRAWTSGIAEELGGRTVVVCGLGSIGLAIARRLAAWDVRVIGVTRDPSLHLAAVGDVRPLDALADACAEASVLIVAAPAAPETRHLVSARVLDALGDGYLVNVGRGSLVDEAALVDRLADGRLRGAGLDVVETEPLPPESPLWTLPEVVLTPHRAGMTPRYPALLAELVATNLAAYLGDGPWRNRLR